VRNQLTTALSTISASFDLRVELLNYQRKFFINEIEKAKNSDVKAYVFGDKKDPVLNAAFISLLNQHHIKVNNLAQKIKLGDYEFEPASSFIVQTEQQNYSLLTTIFEKHTTFKDSIFYDISSWSVPLAFNIPNAEYKNKSLDKKYIGDEIVEPKNPVGMVEESNSTIAFAFQWDKLFSPKVLYKILQAGIKVKVATSPFRANTANGETNFGYGTIIIPIAIQEKESAYIKSALKKIAVENGTNIFSISSGLSLEGSDLGSSNFKIVKFPEVLMLVGQGISSLDAGEMWHLLDQRMEMNVTLIDLINLTRVDLSNYSTLVMTGGTYNLIDSSFVRSLREWIRKGGTLISTGTATEWLIKNKLTKITMTDKNPSKEDSSSLQKPYSQKNKDRDALSIPGAIFQADIDRTHPLGFGYDNNIIYTFVSGDIILQPSKDPYSTPVKYSDKPLVSGFVSKRILNKFINSAAVVSEKFGSGVIIMMTEGPNYRAYWYGTNKLMMNSIFFGPIIN